MPFAVCRLSVCLSHRRRPSLPVCQSVRPPTLAVSGSTSVLCSFTTPVDASFSTHPVHPHRIVFVDKDRLRIFLLLSSAGACYLGDLPHRRGLFFCSFGLLLFQLTFIVRFTRPSATQYHQRRIKDESSRVTVLTQTHRCWPILLKSGSIQSNRKCVNVGIVLSLFIIAASKQVIELFFYRGVGSLFFLYPGGNIEASTPDPSSWTSSSSLSWRS